jgi:esterase/lipase superfamily enzyme
MRAYRNPSIPLRRQAVLLGACVAMAWAQALILPSAYLLRVLAIDPSGGPVAAALVRLDGKEVGVTDETGQYYLLRQPLTGGAHELSVSHPRFATASQSFTLPDGDAPGVEMTVKLVESPVPEAQAPTVGFSGLVQQSRKLEQSRNPVQQPRNYAIVQIFYATDRQDTGSAEPGKRYANQRSEKGELARGTCDVSIPRDHRLGSLEEPSLLRLEYRPDPEKHVLLRRVDPLPTDAFYRQLEDKIARSSRKEAVIFIHGYNIGFEDAARRTAQLAYDIGFDGAPILYSWPSRNRTLAYTADEDTVQWTTVHLRDFLKEVAERTHSSTVHVIAHSMGNRALALALQLIAAEQRGARHPLFHQVVLAAPDIGADTVKLLAREIQPIARRITLYASAHDEALLLSGLLHGALRAGEKSQYLVVVPGIDTVDASSVRTNFLGHSYYRENDSIVADLRELLATEAPPDERRLLIADFLQKLRYWIIRPAKTDATWQPQALAGVGQ